MSEPFPLGRPINRQEPKELTPIPGRPNWFRNRQGEEVYVEPPKPTPTWPFGTAGVEQFDFDE